MASPFDSQSLPLKLAAALNEAASYWGDPGIYPTTTAAQKALMKDYSHGGPITAGWFSILLVREGFTDGSTYLSVSSRTSALESTVANVFHVDLGL